MPEIRPRESAIAFTAVAAVLCALALLGRLQAPPPAAETQNPPPSLRIALNHDSRAALQLLPGIGPALADRVIEARAGRPLTDGADLQARVRGIGPVTAERIEPYVSFE